MLEDVYKTYAWQEAVALGPVLTELIELLPAQEDRGLIMIIQDLMVAVPAAIAGDLIDGGGRRLDPVLRLISALELINQIYPALETRNAMPKVEQLYGRLRSESFHERQPDPEPPVQEEEVPLNVQPDQQQQAA